MTIEGVEGGWKKYKRLLPILHIQSLISNLSLSLCHLDKLQLEVWCALVLRFKFGERGRVLFTRARLLRVIRTEV